jgi:hypothetical protein
VQSLQEIGIDFSVHVIGLDVDAQTAAQLKAISDVAGGVYYDARSEEDLDNALNNINQNILPAGEPPTPLAIASATLVPQPNAEIASEGTVEASSIYDSNYPASLAIDGDLSTSWFSAGAIKGDANPVYTWTGQQDDLIASIELISNREHQVVDFRTGFGFESVTVQVLDAQGNVVFEEGASLEGTPDPDVTFTPNEVGRSIRFIFSGGEAPDCGGFGELKIHVVRPTASLKVSTPAEESSLPSFTANTNMLCREGPGTSHMDRWQLTAGEVVKVLAKWYEDPNWLLVDIEAPATRTDCCWVGGEGSLSVPIDEIIAIDFLPDRLDCSAVR